jgi:hypothetical protein
MPRWHVEVSTTYYDVVEIEAPTEMEARRIARAGNGTRVGIVEYLDSEIHNVTELP